MSGADKWSKPRSSGIPRPPPPPNSSRPDRNWVDSADHHYSWATNANTASQEGTSGRSNAATNTGASGASTQHRHSEQLPPSVGSRDTYGTRSPNGKPQQGGTGYGTNSGSQWMHRRASDKNYGHSNASPPVQPRSSYHQSTRPSTGPVNVPPSHSGHYTRERSTSTDSDNRATALEFEDGAKGRMHDVDDKVLISMADAEVCSCMHVQ